MILIDTENEVDARYQVSAGITTARLEPKFYMFVSWPKFHMTSEGNVVT